MPDYTEKAEALLSFVQAFGNTTMSTNEIKTQLLIAFEDGLNSAPAPAQPVAAPPVIAASNIVIDSTAPAVLEVLS